MTDFNKIHAIHSDRYLARAMAPIIKNNNTLDNRLCNLRAVSKSLNMRNCDDRKNKFGLNGVQYKDGRYKRFFCAFQMPSDCGFFLY